MTKRNGEPKPLFEAEPAPEKAEPKEPSKGGQEMEQEYADLTKRLQALLTEREQLSKEGKAGWSYDDALDLQLQQRDNRWLIEKMGFLTTGEPINEDNVDEAAEEWKKNLKSLQNQEKELKKKLEGLSWFTRMFRSSEEGEIEWNLLRVRKEIGWIQEKLNLYARLEQSDKRKINRLAFGKYVKEAEELDEQIRRVSARIRRMEKESEKEPSIKSRRLQGVKPPPIG